MKGVKMKPSHLTTLIIFAFTCCICITITKAQEPNRDLMKRFRILGVSIPTGGLSATSGQTAGYAKLGFSAGAEFTSEVSTGFELGLLGNLSYNSLDDATIQSQAQNVIPGVKVSTTNWLLINLMGSMGFNASVSENSNFYGRGYIGVMFGSSPEIKLTANSNTVTQSSATATTVSFGFGTGVIVNNQFDIGLRYLTAEPEYNVTASGGGSSASGKFTQPSSVILLSLGYIFQ
jgi:hypothetical protein